MFKKKEKKMCQNPHVTIQLSYLFFKAFAELLNYLL